MSAAAGMQNSSTVADYAELLCHKVHMYMQQLQRSFLYQECVAVPVCSNRCHFYATYRTLIGMKHTRGMVKQSVPPKQC